MSKLSKKRVIMRPKVKAQAAMEYLLLTAVVLAVLVPAAYVFYQYSMESAADAKNAQINKIGNEIVDAAEQVYYMGPPATLKIDAQMPDNVRSMHIVEGSSGYSLIFNVSTDAGYTTPIVFSTKVNISGSFGKSSYSQGLKKIRVKAKEDAEGNKYVWISFKGKCGVNDDCAAEELCSAEECVLCTPQTCPPCYSSQPHCQPCIIDDSAGGCGPNEYCLGGSCAPCQSQETCDGMDNTCNSMIDEGCDDDNDDYCDALLSRQTPYSCSGTTQCCALGGNDCDDANATTNPAAAELCGNTVDENCDGWLCAAQVFASADDAHSMDNGANQYSSTTLILGRLSSSYYDAGFRFQNAQIPKGATITGAKIRYYATSATSYQNSARIYGEDVDSGNDFGSGSTVISFRTKTSAYTFWQPSGYTGWRETADISTAIKEIVDRPGWNPGNAISILIIHNTGGTYRYLYIRPYDANPSQAAQLLVKYS